MSLLTRLLSEDTDVALDEAKKSCPVCGQRPCVKNAKCMEYKKHGTIDGKPTEIHTYGGKKKHEGTFEEALALLERKPTQFVAPSVVEDLEEAKTIAQTWEFKKKGSAEKFYRMMLNLARREKATWHPELNSTGLRVRVSGESYGSGKITPIDQTTFNKLDSLAAAHKGRKTNSQTEDADDEGGEQLDEMFIGRQMRYVDPQELQYTLEDAATACERNWSERKGHRDMKTLQAPHEALVKSLRAAAAKAGDYATVYKRRMDEL